MNRSRLTAAVVLAFIAFISLGMPDGLLGVAWPSMRATFSRPLDSLGLLLIAMTAGYIFSSFSSGAMIRSMGVGRLLAVSCAATGLSLIGFTLVPAWWMIPLCGVFTGLGAGAIDAGLNSHIAEHYDERLMQWLHASFGIGVTIGPLIMTAGLNLFSSWRIGYAVVGAAQIVLAICFAATASIWERPAGDAPPAAGGAAALPSRERALLVETLKKGGVWISLGLFFIYAGIELSLGHWTYTLLTESRGVSSEIAGLLTGSFWAMFTIGRFTAGIYARRLSSPVMINGGIALALCGALLLLADISTAATLTAIVLLGFAVAPVFPGLVSTTYRRVGRAHTANTIGMQIAAAGLGGSGLPALAGVLARRTSLESIPLFLLALILTLILLQIIAHRLPETS